MSADVITEPNNNTWQSECISLDIERLDGDATKDSVLCFLCKEKDTPHPGCKSCHNTRLYFSEKQHKDRELVDDDSLELSFPGPGVVRRNHIYGNYVVASRPIECGEVIILEKPINIGPCGPAEMLPLCLTCCKDIGLSSRCSKCRWPICSTKCEESALHADNECKILVEKNVKWKGTEKELFSVEVLRALFLQDKNRGAWQKVLDFEPHTEARSNDPLAADTTTAISEFIRYKCALAAEYSVNEINHVVGVLCINTFSAVRDVKRYASCLFDKITLFAHDCDPNTQRQLVFLGCDEDTEEVEETSSSPGEICNIAQRVTAARRIEAGEIITIRYIDINQTVLERRAELKDTFYFDCTCSRCLRELMDIQLQLDESTTG